MTTAGLAAKAVGHEVAFHPDHGEAHHGVITKCSYNPWGEMVIVVHLDDDPIGINQNMVLLGRDAEATVDGLHLEAAA